MLQLQGRPLPPVVGRWMSRPDLQKAMFNAGINIFVDENTDNYVPSLDKVSSFHLVTEQEDIRTADLQLTGSLSLFLIGFKDTFVRLVCFFVFRYLCIHSHHKVLKHPVY